MVERRLAKANVASSNLVFRSNENCTGCAVFLLPKNLVRLMRMRPSKKAEGGVREKARRIGGIKSIGHAPSYSGIGS